MAKQAISSDRIAQPSFWPELEPTPPAPRLRQPKPVPGPTSPGIPRSQGDSDGPIDRSAAQQPEGDTRALARPELVPAAGPCGAVGLASPIQMSDPKQAPAAGLDAEAIAGPPPAAGEPAAVGVSLTAPPSAAAPGAEAMPEPTAPALVQLPSFRSGPAARPLPERLLILDTETTGLLSERDHCIEIGAVLFHVAERAVLDQVSFLLPCQDNPAEPINGINAAVSRTPQPWQAGLQFFQAMLDAADLVVAHNVKFDRAWFGREPLPAISKPWLCTMEDIRWPPSLRLKPTPSVRDLALAYSVPVWAAHRALTDCIYLAQVFERCSDLDALLLEGLEPRQLYRACLSYAERHRAREAGFRWNEPLRGAWSRRLSQREVNLLPFPVELAEGESPQSD